MKDFKKSDKKLIDILQNNETIEKESKEEVRDSQFKSIVEFPNFFIAS